MHEDREPEAPGDRCAQTEHDREGDEARILNRPEVDEGEQARRGGDRHGVAEARHERTLDETSMDEFLHDRRADGDGGEIDGYLVGGHVPAEAIARLLEDRPDAVGLALPGMPADSPGMGGDESTWATQPIMLVHSDGSITAWQY